MDELSNFRELHKFLDYWDDKEDIFEMPKSSGHPSFRAVVVYESEKRTTTRVTSITACVLSGPNDGILSLGEAKGLRPEDYHLDFSPDFQEYRYAESTHALVVSGKSEKMGVYKVTITPVSL